MPSVIMDQKEHDFSNENYLEPSLLLSKIELINKSSGSISNIKASFNQMIEKGLIDPTRLILDLGKNFQLTMANVREYTNRLKRNRQWPSHLNDIKSAFASSLSDISLDLKNLSLADSLIHFSVIHYGKGKSASQYIKLISNDTGIDKPAISGWYHGKYMPVKSQSFEKVKIIDEQLNANGLILNTCGLLPPKLISNERTREVKSLPGNLMGELTQYANWKKDRILPSRKSKLINQIKHRIDRMEDGLIDDVQWSYDQSNECRSEGAFHTRMRNYFNALSEELEIDLSEFKFVDIFNNDYIESFINYCRKRGIITSCTLVLTWIISEAKKHSYASVYLCDNESIDHGEWLRYLEFISKNVKLKRKELLKEYEALQGARNVQFILNDENPFIVTNKILEGLYRNARATLSDSVHLSSYRWALAFDIELVCPLRIANLANLKLLESNTERKSLDKFENEKSIGIYFNKTKSCYYIFVHKAHLKNRKSDTVNNIHISLEHLTSKINYLIEKRDEFFDKKPQFKSDYVIGFRIQRGHGNSINSRAAASAFKLITAKVIQAYFPEAKSLGINPHGMRHLVASLYLRDHPEHFLALATLLMDSISTVMETYAHRDDNLNSKKISSWGAGRFGTPNVQGNNCRA